MQLLWLTLVAHLYLYVFCLTVAASYHVTENLQQQLHFKPREGFT